MRDMYNDWCSFSLIFLFLCLLFFYLYTDNKLLQLIPTVNS